MTAPNRKKDIIIVSFEEQIRVGTVKQAVAVWREESGRVCSECKESGRACSESEESGRACSVREESGRVCSESQESGRACSDCAADFYDYSIGIIINWVPKYPKCIRSWFFTCHIELTNSGWSRFRNKDFRDAMTDSSSQFIISDVDHVPLHTVTVQNEGLVGDTVCVFW